MEKEEQASTGKRKIKLNYPVCSYLDEIIYRGFSFINGNKPIENIIDISTALNSLVMGCEDIDESIKNSYCCLYFYLEFQFELLKNIAD
jgi:hypothetical protein